MKKPLLISLFATLVMFALMNTTYAQSYNSSSSLADTGKNRTLAQRPMYKPKPIKIKPIRKELSFGIRLNTDGWSLFADRGKVKTEDEKRSDMFHNVKLWQFEFAEKKDSRESKGSNQQASSTGEKANPYIYGKVNNFYTLKIGRGITKMIAGKPDPGAVSIHWVLVGGASLGMLKPYYVNTLSDGAIKYTPKTAAAFLDPNNITGSAGLGQGLGEIKFIPGAHLKSALHFDFAANRKTVLAVEAGMNVEAYSQGIQLMAYPNSSSILFNLYASFQFGKRW